MPPFKPDKTRACRCGCGHPVPLFIAATGRFKGYARGVPGHRRAQTNARLRAFRRQLLNAHRRAAPVGTRRLHHASAALQYWLIKVPGVRPWQYEHRVIAAQLLGRPLLRSEHVHHLNHDSLDNRPDNLRVLPHGVHTRTHHQITTWSLSAPACVLCHGTTRPHASRGRCRLCYQRLRAAAARPPR